VLAAGTAQGHRIWRRYRNVAPLERAAEVPASLPSVTCVSSSRSASFHSSPARKARAAVATRYPPQSGCAGLLWRQL